MLGACECPAGETRHVHGPNLNFPSPPCRPPADARTSRHAGPDSTSPPQPSPSCPLITPRPLSPTDLADDEKARTSLLRLCQQATGLLEQPHEAVGHLAHSGKRMLCVRIADDLDLFRLLCEKPRSVRELVDVTGAQDGLLVRVLRMLSAIGFAWRRDDGR